MNGNVVEEEPPLRGERTLIGVLFLDVKHPLYWADDSYPVGDAFGRDFVGTSRRIELLVTPLPTNVWSE